MINLLWSGGVPIPAGWVGASLSVCPHAPAQEWPPPCPSLGPGSVIVRRHIGRHLWRLSGSWGAGEAGEEGSGGSAGSQCTHFSQFMFSLPPFHRPSEDRDRGRQWDASFSESGPRMCWREQAIGLLPSRAHRPRQAVLCWPLSVEGPPHPTPFVSPGQRQWGLGGSGPGVFIYLDLDFEIVL